MSFNTIIRRWRRFAAHHVPLRGQVGFWNTTSNGTNRLRRGVHVEGRVRCIFRSPRDWRLGFGAVALQQMDLQTFGNRDGDFHAGQGDTIVY